MESVITMLVMALYMTVIYKATKKKESASKEYLDEAKRMKSLGEQALAQAEKIQSMRSEQQKPKVAHVHLDESNTSPETLEALRQMVLKAQEQYKIECDCPKCTEARGEAKTTGNQYEMDREMVVRLTPEITKMNYDEFVDWLDKAQNGFIQRAIPIFMELDMNERALIMQGYLQYKKENE